MTEETENPVLARLRDIRDAVDGLRKDMLDLKRRITSLEGQVAQLHTQIAHLHDDFARADRPTTGELSRSRKERSVTGIAS